jgi:predicted PurR-regulated permease PerM
MQVQKIYKAAAILAILVLVVIILVYAKGFLVPLAFAGLLAMLLLPITRWLERKGVTRAIAVILSVLVLVAAFGLMILLIGWQVSDLSSDLSKAKAEFTSYIQQARAFVADKLGISKEQQREMLKKQQSSPAGNAGGAVTNILFGIGGFLTDTVLVLVYIFLFLYFRHRIKNFVLKIVANREKGNVESIFSEAQQVTQKYLTGLAMMIVSLWVMYGIGFSIVGVKHAVFFAILCGVLEIVPFIGNLTGTALTIAMSLVQGGDTNLVIGILITYAIVQFIQTYLLEPLVVGAEVNINPLFTIIGLVAGEAIWGIPGMILAIPLIGVTKIICDHITMLKPYGYLLGQEKRPDSKFKLKVKNWLKNIRSS